MRKEYENPDVEEIRIDLESDFLGSTTGQDDPITCVAYCENDE